MNMVASKNTHVDPNDMPLSTLIEKNNDAIDVNFVSRNNFNLIISLSTYFFFCISHSSTKVLRWDVASSLGFPKIVLS